MSEQVHVRLTRKKKDKGLGADRLKKEASKKTPRHFQRQDRSHSHRAGSMDPVVRLLQASSLAEPALLFWYGNSLSS